MVLIGHTTRIFSLAVLSNERLASGSGDLKIRIWNTKNGYTLKTLIGHTGEIHCLVSLPGSPLIKSP